EYIDRYLHEIEREVVKGHVDLRTVIRRYPDLRHYPRSFESIEQGDQARDAPLAEIVGAVQQQAIDRRTPQRDERAQQVRRALVDLGGSDFVGNDRRQFRHNAEISVQQATENGFALAVGRGSIEQVDAGGEHGADDGLRLGGRDFAAQVGDAVGKTESD